MKRTSELLDLLAIDLPVVLAPMAGNSTPELIAAVSNAGGLGSYGCAMLSREQLADECKRIRTLSNRSFNLNFFCHAPPNVTAEQEDAWRAKLAPYYAELDVEVGSSAGGARRPFDEETCDAVLAIGPRVVSFHFGMPKPGLVQRLTAAGMVLMSSATTSAEALRLVDLGADVIVAQGFEAGGHRGMFLTSDINSQVGTMALVPQVVDAVNVPVIATGGIADARGAAAALALGAAAVQVGTAYLFCPQAKVSAPHRAALRGAHDDETVLTNLFTGRPARGLIRPISSSANSGPSTRPRRSFRLPLTRSRRCVPRPSGVARAISRRCGPGRRRRSRARSMLPISPAALQRACSRFWATLATRRAARRAGSARPRIINTRDRCASKSR
jgi:nitronate monooxygenase